MSANALTALPASLPPALEMLDVSYNNIAGSAPPVSGSLLILNLEGNALTGELPGFLPVTAAAPPAGGRRHARRRLQQAMVVDASVRAPAALLGMRNVRCVMMTGCLGRRRRKVRARA